MIENLNSEQLLTAAGFIIVLLYAVKVLWEKLNQHEKTIQRLNDDKTELLKDTLGEIGESTTVLKSAIDFVKGDRS